MDGANVRTLRIAASLAVALTTIQAATYSRPWKIYVVAHNHVDIGYTGLVPEVERTWCEQIDAAIAAAERGFKWTLETSLLFDVYQRHRKPENVQQLVRLIKEGKIEVASLYTNILSDTTGPEELVRGTFFANERLRREYGIVSQTAMTGDVPGATWGMARTLAGTGTRYFMFAPGRYKNLWDGAPHPDLFYWKAPDGSRVLTMLRSGIYFFYASGRMFTLPAKDMEEQVAAMLKYYESLGARYPYDAIAVQVSSDNGRPQLALLDAIREFNARHANPQAHLATASEFFTYVEEKFGKQIPELAGEFTSGWTDMPGNFAAASALKRKAASRILAAEKLSVLEALTSGHLPYPAETIERVYKDLLLYSDHTNGISNWLWEHDLLLQSRGDINSPVWDYYKESWEPKKEYANTAWQAADGMLGDALERLSSKVASTGRSVVVFNPLSWPRTDAVRIQTRELRALSGSPAKNELVDEATGRRVRAQILDFDDRYQTVTFLAHDVPALGYKTYRVVPVETAAKMPDEVQVNGNIIENRFYRVQLDTQTGGVQSIFDKELKRELADQKGVERVNQYIYHSLTGDHEALYNDNRGAHFGRIPTKDFKIAVFTPLAARIGPGYSGAAFRSLRSEIHMDHGPAPADIVQDVILYPGVKRIDFVNRIRKKETLAKEEAYYAFPFDVTGFQARVDLPGAVARIPEDQLPGSFTGFTGIGHWADLSNSQFGVTVATRDVPAVEFGEIRTNDWSREYRPTRGALFFYVMNNRWNTNQQLWQGSESWRLGFLEVAFSVTSHAGGLREADAVRFGWEYNTPLAAQVIDRQDGTLKASASFCTGLPGNVILQSLKRAEDGKGWVARFYEIGGQASKVAWSGMPWKPRRADITDLVERSPRPAALEGDRIIFSIAPRQMVTIRVEL